MTSTQEALPDDLLAPAVNHDPHPYLRTLRERDPVHWSERHRAWLVTRYDDSSAALMNFKALSSDRVRPLLDVMSDEQRAAAGPVYEMITGWMVVTDPPEHRRLRKLAPSVQPAPRGGYGGQDPAAGRPACSTEFIGDGHEDLIAALHLPASRHRDRRDHRRPAGGRWRFRDWSQALAHVAFGASGDDRDDRYARSMEGLEQMFEYLGGLLEARRSRARRGHDQRPDGGRRRRLALRP